MKTHCHTQQCSSIYTQGTMRRLGDMPNMCSKAWFAAGRVVRVIAETFIVQPWSQSPDLSSQESIIKRDTRGYRE